MEIPHISGRIVVLRKQNNSVGVRTVPKFPITCHMVDHAFRLFMDTGRKSKEISPLS
jgi:hypothetical protein